MIRVEERRVKRAGSEDARGREVNTERQSSKGAAEGDGDGL